MAAFEKMARVVFSVSVKAAHTIRMVKMTSRRLINTFSDNSSEGHCDLEEGSFVHAAKTVLIYSFAAVQSPSEEFVGSHLGLRLR